MNGATFNLRGAVLAGGMSRRFGSDKALVKFDGVPLLHKLIGVLSCVVSDPVVIVNTPERYGDASFKRFTDITPGCGPLGGIHTALTRMHADAILILTCDMPLVSEEFLRALIASWQSGDAAVVAKSAIGVEPFPGIYAASLISRIESALSAHHFSVRQFLAGVSGVRRIETRDFKKNFFNMNTPEDFVAIQGGQYVNARTNGTDLDTHHRDGVVRR